MSRRSTAVAVLVAVLTMVPATAQAHFKNSAGQWLYRYYTHDSNCNSNGSSLWVDPLNVINWQYGYAGHANSHIQNDTGFGPTSFSNHQVACEANSIDSPDPYSIEVQDDYTQSDGSPASRYHLRIFTINHSHTEDINRVSFMDLHHEHLDCSILPPGCDHIIDDDWENSEAFLLTKMDPHHNVQANEYDHGSSGMFRGFFDNGLISRIGGLHDGVY